MKNPTEQLIRRAQIYWFSDGLTEIGFAVMCIVLSLYFYGQAALPPDSVFYRILDVGFLLILLGSGVVTRRLVTNFKARLTYPRTGYVSFHPPTTLHRAGSVVLAMIISLLIVALLSSTEDIDAYMPAVSGILAGAALTYLAYRNGLLRFYLLAAVSSFLGSGLSLTGTGDMFGLSLYYGLMGLALLISGLLVLRDYLLKTHPPEDLQESRQG